MTRVSILKISMTETRHFRRLVTFLADIDSLASINADDELQALVDECRDDLLPETTDSDA